MLISRTCSVRCGFECESWDCVKRNVTASLRTGRETSIYYKNGKIINEWENIFFTYYSKNIYKNKINQMWLVNNKCEIICKKIHTNEYRRNQNDYIDNKNNKLAIEWKKY